MDERFCDLHNGITLCYETFGDRSDPTALLIMGLGTQMVAWHEDFCRQLAASGFHVVRFDNRDIGRSTHLPGPPPTVRQLLLRSKRAAHYRLADMADDAARLLTELDLAPAHVIGASMGGMIAQTLAARRPELVRSLVSIMSNTVRSAGATPTSRTSSACSRRLARAACRGSRWRSASSLSSATTATTTWQGRDGSSRRSSPPATARRSCARSSRRRLSCTAPPTRSCVLPAAARPRARSRARSC
jgi:pimeloyl-ACP methyl ester carboxylesterase